MLAFNGNRISQGNLEYQLITTYRNLNIIIMLLVIIIIIIILNITVISF